jgi:nucleoside-diphosphate-sugar epimerase
VRPSTDAKKQAALESECIVYSDSVAELHSVIKTANITGIVHFASCFLAVHTPEDIDDLVSSNITLGTKLAEASLGTSVEFFITTGTFWQHYDPNPSYVPTNLYAATKQAFGDVLKYYESTSSLKTLQLLLNDTYGPKDPRKKLISLLMSGLDKPLDMSPGEQLIELTHVQDVCHAYIHAIKLLTSPEGAKYSGATFTVSSGEAMSLKDIVKTVERVTGRVLPINWGKRPYRDREVMVPWQHGTPLPGWKAQIKLEEGLHEYT